MEQHRLHTELSKCYLESKREELKQYYALMHHCDICVAEQYIPRPTDVVETKSGSIHFIVSNPSKICRLPGRYSVVAKVNSFHYIVDEIIDCDVFDGRVRTETIPAYIEMNLEEEQKSMFNGIVANILLETTQHNTREYSLVNLIPYSQIQETGISDFNF